MKHLFTPDDMRWEAVRDGDAVELAPGVYHIESPIQLTALHAVTITGQGAVFSGSTYAHVEWKRADTDIYAAELGCKASPDAVAIGGRHFRMARYPHYDDNIHPMGGYAADCLEFAARAGKPEGAYLHAMHSHMWGDMHYLIVGLDAQGKPQLEGGWQNNRQMGIHGEYRYVENLREALGADGEFYYDAERQVLYVCSITEPCQDVELIINPYILRALDCSALTLEGITFCNTARTFMADYEPLGRSDWSIHRGGALYFERCRQIGIRDCELRNIGGNAVFANGNVERVSIERCHFHDIGASCVCMVGHSSCLRYSFDNYDQQNRVEDLEASGPIGMEYVRDCRVEDCLMYDFGLVEKQCAGVQISMAARIHVAHCTMYDCPRAAINIGENSFGGHVIEHCDVFNTVLETGDHGAFNSWGRDRFWSETQLEPSAREELALKDSCEPVRICDNRMRCDHGWDIDLDDGSSNYIIERNLCLNGGIKLREGFKRVCRNNITVNNTIHPHVWFEGSDDVVEHNILFAPYKPIGMKFAWGRSVDRNILYIPGAACAHAHELSDLSGQDAHSLKLDIEFTDAPNGNYTLSTEQCAQTGFENLTQDYGVRSEKLKRLARACPLPVPVAYRDVTGNSVVISGARMKDVETDGEMSAFATAGHTGVLILEVEVYSQWFAEGMRADRVIISANGRAVSNTRELKKLLDSTAPGERLQLELKGHSGEITALNITVLGG